MTTALKRSVHSFKERNCHLQDMEGADKEEIKGGHAPAQKVGGMRVVQHKHPEKSSDKEPAKQLTEEEKIEFGEDKPVKPPSVRHEL